MAANHRGGKMSRIIRVRNGVGVLLIVAGLILVIAAVGKPNILLGIIGGSAIGMGISILFKDWLERNW